MSEKVKNAVNYDAVMRRELEKRKAEEEMGAARARLLLHSCCAPCSSACLEILKDFLSVTVFYYNPNIDEKEEYEKRKAEQIRFLRNRLGGVYRLRLRLRGVRKNRARQRKLPRGRRALLRVL